MSLPFYRVQFMPGAGPFDAPSGSWTTIAKELVRSLEWSDGRDNELDQFGPSSATIVLNNNDRLFDPEYTAGTYFGQLLPRVPFRIQLSTDDSTWVDQFYGFVRDGWEQMYTQSARADCVVHLGDLLGVLESEPLPRTAYEVEVLADSPEAVWQLDETAGVQMTDSSGNGNHGAYENGIQGQDSLIEGEGNSFEVPHSDDSRGIYKGAGLPTGPPCSWECWVRFSRTDPALYSTFLNVQRDTARNTFVALHVGPDATVSPNGEAAVQFFLTGASALQFRGHTRVDDNLRHHVVVTMASTTYADIKLYVDGVEQTKTLISGTDGANWTSHLWWTVANVDGTVERGLNGLIDGVAIYSSALSAARVLAHFEAGADAFDGEFSGDRIDRVLDIVGVPAGLRDIATGDTTVGPANYAGQSALSYLQKVVESEQGVLFIDHRGGGTLKFRGRYARLTESRSTASQASFDSCDYRPDIQPEPNGISTVVNVVDVSWRGGQETVTDDDSRAAYGAQSRSISTEAPTASAARNAGQWMIARYKDPQTRLREVPLDLAGKSDLWPTILDLRISDRITVQRHPNSIGAPINNQLIIERRDIALHEDGSWTASYRLSNADETDVWVWGVSLWGIDTAWG